VHAVFFFFFFFEFCGIPFPAGRSYPTHHQAAQGEHPQFQRTHGRSSGTSRCGPAVTCNSGATTTEEHARRRDLYTGIEGAGWAFPLATPHRPYADRLGEPGNKSVSRLSGAASACANRQTFRRSLWTDSQAGHPAEQQPKRRRAFSPRTVRSPTRMRPRRYSGEFLRSPQTTCVTASGCLVHFWCD